LKTIGSSGRTRTCNLVVTRTPEFLLGLDYLITRFFGPKGGCRALPPSFARGTSCCSSLCTFPDYDTPSRLGSGLPFSATCGSQASLNSPDFSTTISRGSCNSLQPPALPIELPRSRFINLTKIGTNFNQKR
jgi:hypothetical protein